MAVWVQPVNQSALVFSPFCDWVDNSRWRCGSAWISKQFNHTLQTQEGRLKTLFSCVAGQYPLTEDWLRVLESWTATPSLCSGVISSVRIWGPACQDQKRPGKDDCLGFLPSTPELACAGDLLLPAVRVKFERHLPREALSSSFQ